VTNSTTAGGQLLAWVENSATENYGVSYQEERVADDGHLVLIDNQSGRRVKTSSTPSTEGRITPWREDFDPARTPELPARVARSNSERMDASMVSRLFG
jgi:hypothetical protein